MVDELESELKKAIVKKNLEKLDKWREISSEIEQKKTEENKI